MKKRIMKNIIVTFLIAFISLPLFSQTGYKIPETRDVVVNYQDSTIKAQILNDKRKIRFDNSCEYYWYYNRQVGHNFGGYTGVLLHGKYTIIDAEGNLVEQGTFNEGRKTGEWKRWYTNGKIQTLSQWKEGKLNGKFINYTEEGKISSEHSYSNGLLHGKSIWYMADGNVIEKNFEEGKEVQNEVATEENMEKDDVKENKVKMFFKNLISKMKRKNKEEEGITDETFME